MTDFIAWLVDQVARGQLQGVEGVYEALTPEANEAFRIVGEQRLERLEEQRSDDDGGVSEEELRSWLAE